MKRTLKCDLLLGTLLALMLLDGLLTYLNTPDLAREANPLASVFGLGWGALFTVNFVVFVGTFFMARHTFVKYETVIAPVANRREYMSELYFGRPDKFTWTLYRMPTRWKPLFAVFGYTLLLAMIFDRAIIVLEWLTVDVWVPLYDSLRQMAPYHRLDMVLSLLLMIYLMAHWFEREYQRSRKAMAAQADESAGQDA